MLTMKVVLLSTGVVSMAVILKLSLPVILDFLTSELPLLSSLALSWLRPPYLYLLINCIILSVVASSKLQPRGDESLSPSPDNFAVVSYPVVVEEGENPADDASPVEVLFGYVDQEKTPLRAVAEPEEEERETANDGGDGGGVSGGADFVLSRSMWAPPKRDAVEYSPASSAEKPPVSLRFGHRRAIKASPDGKALLKVSRPKRQETLESTWRSITEGRPMPLTRHLKKSDTFIGASQDASSVRVMKKSDTFTDGVTGTGNSSPASRSGGKLRREASLSQDELNRRVEAFIKKFNEEMRLQRQQSLDRYRELVSRGAH